ncbi:MAG: hypothetical protein M1816_000526 [Peltula sp. TS41687]|nr:MAG: hypothetical protein M1816_000526 [Peltula sp. TS41687]
MSSSFCESMSHRILKPISKPTVPNPELPVEQPHEVEAMTRRFTLEYLLTNTSSAGTTGDRLTRKEGGGYFYYASYGIRVQLAAASCLTPRPTWPHRTRTEYTHRPRSSERYREREAWGEVPVTRKLQERPYYSTSTLVHILQARNVITVVLAETFDLMVFSSDCSDRSDGKGAEAPEKN